MIKTVILLSVAEKIFDFLTKKKEEHGEGKLLRWTFSCHIDQKQSNFVSKEKINKWLDIIAKNRKAVYTPNRELKAMEINYLVELEENKKNGNI